MRPANTPVGKTYRLKQSIRQGLGLRFQIASFVKRHWNFLGFGVYNHLIKRMKYAGKDDLKDFAQLDQLLTKLRDDKECHMCKKFICGFIKLILDE